MAQAERIHFLELKVKKYLQNTHRGYIMIGKENHKYTHFDKGW